MINKKMQNKVLAASGVILGVLLITCVTKSIKASEFTSKKQLEEMGSILSDNTLFQEDETASDGNGSQSNHYAVGDHIVITQSEMDWKMEVYAILKSPNSEEQAYQELCKTKSEYYYAAQQGYTCSDQELDEYFELLKDMYNDTDPHGEVNGLDEIKPMVEAAGGIEEYCEQVRDISRHKFVIRKFYDDQEQAYLATLDESMEWNDKVELWLQEKERISNQIVENEHIHKVTQSE
ncbi:MAG: hypothetical protein ACI4EG_01045 [Fusicatenibacter sp.]|nr:hypothetical protein [Fusicatenibacter sp.]